MIKTQISNFLNQFLSEGAKMIEKLFGENNLNCKFNLFPNFQFQAHEWKIFYCQFTAQNDPN